MKRLSKEDLNSGTELDLDLDVAIIGGGVSGLYTGWRILKSQSALTKVHVFELSDRIGGRLESVILPGMQIFGELGGMRYMLGHKIVNTLVNNYLNLTAIPFPMGDDNHRLFYMRKQRFLASAWADAQTKKPYAPFMTRYQLNNDDVGFSSDQLFNKIVYDVLMADPNFKAKYGDKLKHPDTWTYDFSGLNAEDWNNIKPVLTYYFPGPYNGMKVNNMGFWNLIKDQAGEEGYDFLAVAGGYYSNTINWNAAEAFPYMVGDFSQADTQYFTLKGGYDIIAYALAVQYLGLGGMIWAQNRLTNFKRNPGIAAHGQSTSGARKYQLTIFNEATQTSWNVYADKIVLAMPRRSLEMLNQFNSFFDPDTQQERQAHIESVIMEPSFKLLMGFEEPWWKDPQILGATSGESVTDLPMRQCYYFGTDPNDSHSMFLSSYNDMRTIQFWSALEPQPASNEKHKKRLRLERHTTHPHKRWTPRATRLASQEALDALRDVQASEVMVLEAMSQVRELHGKPQIPNPYVTYFKDWTEDPFGGGYHAWKAGVNVGDTMRYMRRPDLNEDIHICGEAYSDQQGWVEGALCEAEKMLIEYFGLSRLVPGYYLGW